MVPRSRQDHLVDRLLSERLKLLCRQNSIRCCFGSCGWSFEWRREAWTLPFSTTSFVVCWITETPSLEPNRSCSTSLRSVSFVSSPERFSFSSLTSLSSKLPSRSAVINHFFFCLLCLLRCGILDQLPKNCIFFLS